MEPENIGNGARAYWSGNELVIHSRSGVMFLSRAEAERLEKFIRNNTTLPELEGEAKHCTAQEAEIGEEVLLYCDGVHVAAIRIGPTVVHIQTVGVSVVGSAVLPGHTIRRYDGRWQVEAVQG